jgi:hypothetical protein
MAGGIGAEMLRAKMVRDVTRPVVALQSIPFQVQHEVFDDHDERPGGLLSADLMATSADLSALSQRAAEASIGVVRRRKMNEKYRFFVEGIARILI